MKILKFELGEAQDNLLAKRKEFTQILAEEKKKIDEKLEVILSGIDSSSLDDGLTEIEKQLESVSQEITAINDEINNQDLLISAKLSNDKVLAAQEKLARKRDGAQAPSEAASWPAEN